jgi:hypothetical protein
LVLGKPSNRKPFTRVLFQRCPDHADDNGIRYQLTTVHEVLASNPRAVPFLISLEEYLLY